jgi:hypothetical protein
MPTMMISSAVMTCGISLPGSLSVSNPFEVLLRAVGRQASGTLYLPGSRTRVSATAIATEEGAPTGEPGGDRNVVSGRSDGRQRAELMTANGHLPDRVRAFSRGRRHTGTASTS